MDTTFWLIVLIVCIIVEGVTQGIVSIWFAIGAGAAFAAASFGAPMSLQLFLFAAVSLLSLLFTRPVLKKMMMFRFTPTNHELDIGKMAIVTETVDNSRNCGRVSLNGVEWSAKSRSGEILEKGASVIVTAIAATTLTVKRSQL